MRARMMTLIAQAGSEGIAPAELARLLNVSEKTIQNYAAKNKLIVRTGRAQMTRYSFPPNVHILPPVENEEVPSGPVPDPA